MLAHAGTIALLQALLTPVVAIIALGIAFAQWWTARNKLKLDLFERRCKIYEATRKALLEIGTGDRLTGPTREAFAANALAATWLLDDELDRYLRENLWPAMTLYSEPLDAGESAKERAKAKRMRARWAEAELAITQAKFSRFLKLDESFSDWLRRRLPQIQPVTR